MFCPYTGSLLQLDAVANAASSKLSGYSISLNGMSIRIVQCKKSIYQLIYIHALSCFCLLESASPHRFGPTASRALAELEDRVVVVHETDMNEYARQYDLEPLVKSEARLEEEEALQTRTRATVEETCPKCGHEGLEFYTLQLRSADEGQTVFYECPQCSHKYSQNN